MGMGGGSDGDWQAEGWTPPAESAESREALIVDVAGFEGPLDLLLDLARHQKVDLARISILALAEQYLAFINAVRRLRLELAADYLVMAAWLAYLKSRLLLPAPVRADEPPPEDLAARLAFRLQRLQAMREAAARLMAGSLLGRDVFQRGDPEPLVVERRSDYADNLVDLLKAYAERRQQQASHRTYAPRKLPVVTISEARVALERLIGRMDDWGRLDSFLFQYLQPEAEPRTLIASSFAASLELAREGFVELRQDGFCAPVYLRRRLSVES